MTLGSSVPFPYHSRVNPRSSTSSNVATITWPLHQMPLAIVQYIAFAGRAHTVIEACNGVLERRLLPTINSLGFLPHSMLIGADHMRQ
eukprot:2807738-Pleurochrysis_carterae.AAC.1